MKNSIPYLEQPCERCGNKKALTEVHKEILKNLSGGSEIEYSQIVCTNAACQKIFEVNLAEKRIKAEEIKLKREEAKAARAKTTIGAGSLSKVMV